MEKRILAIMVTLVVVAALVVGFVMIAAGGGIRIGGGGFTDLFSDLEYNGNETDNMELSIPNDWAGDTKVVKDVIVDMTYWKQSVSPTTAVYWTTMYFVFVGDEWSTPYLDDGQDFRVPVTYGSLWLNVVHGQFSITVSTATNLSEDFGIGDTITLESVIKTNRNAVLAFDTWSVKGVV